MDLVITGGTVVDGTGGPSRSADVGIEDGRIIAVGRVSTASAKRVVDADGALVTPGWVDIHTHYDGQATWDDHLQPSSGHGVTTVVMGNCGVGFAPVRATDHDALIELMEGVEDIPGAALHEGLPWDWSSYPDFLDALERRPHDIDCAAQVCHGPIRLFVMGERGANREPATAEEIAEMGRLAAEGVAAGALGFTTSRTLNHRTSKGQPTPTLTAAREELVGIASAIGRTGQGVLQVVSDFPEFDEEMGTLFGMMRASGRPLSVSLLQTAPGTGYRRVLDALTEARDQGLEMRAQVAARAVGVMIGLQGTVNPIRHCPSHKAVAGLPIPQRREALRAVRDELAAEYHGNRLFTLDRVFPISDPPDYEPDPSTSVAAQAAARGVSPESLFIDMLLDNEFLYLPVLNYFDGNLDAAAEMLDHEFTVPGLGDGGAHVGTICDGSFPTTLLSYWGRDRTKGRRFTPEWIVEQQCRATARAVGLLDRGVLAPGMRADINVIDFSNLRLHAPSMAFDLPAGGKRLTQKADGYVHTFVAGAEIMASGSPTGALPGRLIRGPQCAPSPGS